MTIQVYSRVMRPLLLLSALLPTLLTAQHCGYDFACIITPRTVYPYQQRVQLLQLGDVIMSGNGCQPTTRDP
jgi:hypothetical protein